MPDMAAAAQRWSHKLTRGRLFHNYQPPLTNRQILRLARLLNPAPTAMAPAFGLVRAPKQPSIQAVLLQHRECGIHGSTSKACSEAPKACDRRARCPTSAADAGAWAANAASDAPADPYYYYLDLRATIALLQACSPKQQQPLEPKQQVHKEGKLVEDAEPGFGIVSCLSLCTSLNATDVVSDPSAAYDVVLAGRDSKGSIGGVVGSGGGVFHRSLLDCRALLSPAALLPSDSAELVEQCLLEQLKQQKPQQEPTQSHLKPKPPSPVPGGSDLDPPFTKTPVSPSVDPLVAAAAEWLLARMGCRVRPLASPPPSLAWPMSLPQPAAGPGVPSAAPRKQSSWRPGTRANSLSAHHHYQKSPSAQTAVLEKRLSWRQSNKIQPLAPPTSPCVSSPPTPAGAAAGEDHPGKLFEHRPDYLLSPPASPSLPFPPPPLGDASTPGKRPSLWPGGGRVYPLVPLPSPCTTQHPPSPAAEPADGNDASSGLLRGTRRQHPSVAAPTSPPPAGRPRASTRAHCWTRQEPAIKSLGSFELAAENATNGTEAARLRVSRLLDGSSDSGWVGAVGYGSSSGSGDMLCKAKTVAMAEAEADAKAKADAEAEAEAKTEAERARVLALYNALRQFVNAMMTWQVGVKRWHDRVLRQQTTMRAQNMKMLLALKQAPRSISTGALMPVADGPRLMRSPQLWRPSSVKLADDASIGSKHNSNQGGNGSSGESEDPLIADKPRWSTADFALARSSSSTVSAPSTPRQVARQQQGHRDSRSRALLSQPGQAQSEDGAAGICSSGNSCNRGSNRNGSAGGEPDLDRVREGALLEALDLADGGRASADPTRGSLPNSKTDEPRDCRGGKTRTLAPSVLVSSTDDGQAAPSKQQQQRQRQQKHQKPQQKGQKRPRLSAVATGIARVDVTTTLGARGGTATAQATAPAASEGDGIAGSSTGKAPSSAKPPPVPGDAAREPAALAQGQSSQSQNRKRGPRRQISNAVRVVASASATTTNGSTADTVTGGSNAGTGDAGVSPAIGAAKCVCAAAGMEGAAAGITKAQGDGFTSDSILANPQQQQQQKLQLLKQQQYERQQQLQLQQQIEQMRQQVQQLQQHLAGLSGAGAAADRPK